MGVPEVPNGWSSLVHNGLDDEWSCCFPPYAPLPLVRHERELDVGERLASELYVIGRERGGVTRASLPATPAH